MTERQRGRERRAVRGGGRELEIEEEEGEEGGGGGGEGGRKGWEERGRGGGGGVRPPGSSPRRGGWRDRSVRNTSKGVVTRTRHCSVRFA